MTVIDFDIWGEPDENGVSTLNSERPEAGPREVHDDFSRNINENMLDLGIRENTDYNGVEEDAHPFIYIDADFNQHAEDAVADTGCMDRQVGGNLRFACRRAGIAGSTSISVHDNPGWGWTSVLFNPDVVSE